MLPPARLPPDRPSAVTSVIFRTSECRGRPKAPVAVVNEDRVVLERWSKRPRTPMAVARRARIVLLAAEGLNNNVVAERSG